MKKRKALKVYKEQAEKLQNAGYENLDIRTLEYLISRGVDTPEKIRKFYDYSFADIPAVSTFKDGEKALTRIVHAIKKGEKILIYGDYDVDGITATSILLNTFKDLGVDADWYINDRFVEGFGMKISGLEKALKKSHYDLVITVDNGVDRLEEAQYLKEKGIDLVITDHHQPLETGEVPEAIAVVDAHRLDDTSAFREMCGAGLSLIFALNIYAETKGYDLNNVDSVHEIIKTKLFKHSYLMAGFATICDVVSLHDYNRYLVKKAVELANSSEFIHPSWEVLKTKTGKKIIEASTFGWYFGPLVNALSRMVGDVSDAVTLFTTEDLSTAQGCIDRLFEVNEQRKDLTKAQLEMANADIIINERQEAPANILYGDYYEGTAGIIAGKILDTTKKPTFVLCRSKEYPGLLKGSVRSPEGINAKELLDGIKKLLVSYGGHSGAAGISLMEKDVKQFISYVDTTIPQIKETCEEVESIDFVLTPKKLTCDFIKQIKELEPFGCDFEEPQFLLQGCVTSSRMLETRAGQSAKLNLDYKVECLWWNAWDMWKEILRKSPITLPTGETPVLVYGKPNINEFRGELKPQLIVNKVDFWDVKKLGIQPVVGYSEVNYRKAGV